MGIEESLKLLESYKIQSQPTIMYPTKRTFEMLQEMAKEESNEHLSFSN